VEHAANAARRVESSATGAWPCALVKRGLAGVSMKDAKAFKEGAGVHEH
jgi:hypothetical protein